MKWKPRIVELGSILPLLVFLLATSCGMRGISGTAPLNLRPTLVLSQVPAPADTLGTYVYELSWAGHDPDGRVNGFYYAVDPPSRLLADTAWVGTTENRRIFVFRSDSIGAQSATHARRFHTVAVYCVDDQGARSAVAFASFTTTTVTPTVQIVSPRPSALLAREMAPSVRVQWVGDDPDGLTSRQPVSYRWKLFGEATDLLPITILANPDTLRQRFAPTFNEWDSLPGTTPRLDIRNLTPGQSYLFAVVAIDEAGAYSPVLSGDQNLFLFRVSAAATLGPIITLTSQVFDYTFPSGGVLTDRSQWLFAEFPAKKLIPLDWAALTTPGSFVRSYRWAVDLTRIDDDDPRSDEETDLTHWSRPSLATGTILPAFTPKGISGSETHLFYLEATDNLGLLSRVCLEFTVVEATFDRELLIVDDTFFSIDRRGSAGCTAPPVGIWPSAAELDTFLFAVGNVPYRCYPSGTLSTPGVFSGYPFDTLGTHFTPASAITLRELGRYRHIIWMTDLTSAFLYEQPARSSIHPMPLLREWTTAPTQNPLATWLTQGGQLWLLGGGGALASLRAFDGPGTLSNVFTVQEGELRPGTLMYSQAHWQSAITVERSFRATRSSSAIGGRVGTLDYSRLPPELLEKTPTTDPLPPLRTGNFYLTSYAAEHLSQPNHVNEPASPSGPQVSVLDTLYETSGGEAGSGWPLMTIYHGRDNGTFVFSGFPPWYFQREHTTALVDFVLQEVWGLSRESMPRLASPPPRERQQKRTPRQPSRKV